MRRIKRFNVPGIITRVLVGLRFYCIHIVPVLMLILFSGNSFSSSIVCICLRLFFFISTNHTICEAKNIPCSFVFPKAVLTN